MRHPHRHRARWLQHGGARQPCHSAGLRGSFGSSTVCTHDWAVRHLRCQGRARLGRERRRHVATLTFQLHLAREGGEVRLWPRVMSGSGGEVSVTWRGKCSGGVALVGLL